MTDKPNHNPHALKPNTWAYRASVTWWIRDSSQGEMDGWMGASCNDRYLHLPHNFPWPNYPQFLQRPPTASSTSLLHHQIHVTNLIINPKKMPAQMVWLSRNVQNCTKSGETCESRSTDADNGFQKPLLSHRIRAFMTCSVAWSCVRILEGLIVHANAHNSDKQCWGFEWYFQAYVCQRGMPQVFVQIRSA